VDFQQLHLQSVQRVGHTNAYSSSDAYTHCNSNAVTVTNSDSTSHSYTDANGGANSDANLHADADPWLRWRGNCKSNTRVDLHFLSGYFPVDRRRRYRVCTDTW
jgi:hypothetical protein